MPSVLWRCWLGGRNGIRPVKIWVTVCWHGYLSRARCRLAYGPADATATHCLLRQWNPDWFYLSGTGSPLCSSGYSKNKRRAFLPGRAYSKSVLRTFTFSALTLLVGRQEGHPACKKLEWWGAGVVICLERGADLHMAQRIPLPLTVCCFSKIQIGFTFLVPAHPGSPGQRAIKRVYVCMYCSNLWLLWIELVHYIIHELLKLCTPKNSLE